MNQVLPIQFAVVIKYFKMTFLYLMIKLLKVPENQQRAGKFISKRNHMSTV